MQISKPAKNVDEYLSWLPVKDRKALQQIRKTILSACPKAEERISYKIPFYRYNGYLVFFAGFKDHLSIYVPGKEILQSLAKELKPYHVKGATIHFTADKPLPASLVKRIVKARMKLNAQK